MWQHYQVEPIQLITWRVNLIGYSHCHHRMTPIRMQLAHMPLALFACPFLQVMRARTLLSCKRIHTTSMEEHDLKTPMIIRVKYFISTWVLSFLKFSILVFICFIGGTWVMSKNSLSTFFTFLVQLLTTCHVSIAEVNTYVAPYKKN